MKAVTSDIEKNVVAPKSVAFALRIIRAYELLYTGENDPILLGQLLQSGTSISTLVMEAELTESKPDFIGAIDMALKEAHKTAGWLLLLKKRSYINVPEYEKLKADCDEITVMLYDIIYQLQ